MDKIIVTGGRKLRGEVEVSGAKNAALPMMAAALLTDQESIIENVPNLKDIRTMLDLLNSLGAKGEYRDGTVTITPGNTLVPVAPYELVSTMRASVCVLGPLLARVGNAEVSLPGGCVIGPRPIDLHLKGLEALGASTEIRHGYVHARMHKRLRGNDIYLGGAFGSSVLATANVMMAATLARGQTTIEDAACEPEIVDLACFLIRMGAKIQGVGSKRIEIEGVNKLHGAKTAIIADRVEVGTYLFAAAMTGGDVLVKKADPNHQNVVIDKLRQAGARVDRGKSSIRVRRTGRLQPVNVTTLPYPGFPTDLQAQMMALMTITPGISVITEKIYPDRYMHVSELNRMGSRIFLEGPSAIVQGVKRLSGAPVMASDLRASAALVIAGLVAEGSTEIHRVYHLDRGYERIEEKLSQLGAAISRQKEQVPEQKSDSSMALELEAVG
ncbi:MAG: UDP-N-acetylglucosamine 1-carboxyvinyltransferase [Candidatus Omnitrophota bacterium]|nr:UDP-N-acetylglucosamine 1-carboxyvinyltransferase [Candidatus Omnitrophota bacterium]